MKWKAETPKFGDIIRTKVTFYHHYGIFKNENEVIQFGLPNDVSRPAKEVKVLKSDIYAFLSGSEVEVGFPDKAEIKKMRSPEDIVSLAESRIGEGGYDILHNNCEHFANECAFGEHRSGFLDGVRQKLRKKLDI